MERGRGRTSQADLGSREVTLNSSGARVEGLPLRACQPALFLLSLLYSKDLKMFVREGKGTPQAGG